MRRRSGIDEPVDEAEQFEFPLKVAVCAWCRPKPRTTVNLPPISHGICPRHLRKMRMKLQKMAGQTGMP
jgi:hypothetical protein